MAAVDAAGLCLIRFAGVILGGRRVVAGLTPRLCGRHSTPCRTRRIRQPAAVTASNSGTHSSLRVIATSRSWRVSDLTRLSDVTVPHLERRCKELLLVDMLLVLASIQLAVELG